MKKYYGYLYETLYIVGAHKLNSRNNITNETMKIPRAIYALDTLQVIRFKVSIIILEHTNSAETQQTLTDRDIRLAVQYELNYD